MSLLLGGLGSIVVYFSRIANKFEDKVDNISLNLLPSLNYSISSFIEATEIFLFDSQISQYKGKIDIINIELEKKMSSGDMIFLEKNLQDNLLKLRKDLKQFQSILGKVKESPNTAAILKYSFESKEGFMEPEMKLYSIFEAAKNIQIEIKDKINKVRLRSKVYQVIIAFFIGIVITAINYYKM
jgi:hypothetical protein